MTKNKQYQKIKRIRAKADRLLQEVATKNGYCESCGTRDNICGHHFTPKSLSNNLRYDLMNIIVLCRGCHFKHHNGDPQIYENFTKNKSVGWFDYIKENRDKLVKPTLTWYKEKIELLK